MTAGSADGWRLPENRDRWLELIDRVDFRRTKPPRKKATLDGARPDHVLVDELADWGLLDDPVPMPFVIMEEEEP